MIQIIKYKDLGGADHGWLKAKHHFSFASYFNPKRICFGTIRVINAEEMTIDVDKTKDKVKELEKIMRRLHPHRRI